MPHAAVTKTFTFDAAHQLPNHKGKCRNLHGHTYKVEITCYGEVDDRRWTDRDGLRGNSSHGMVVDFDDVKTAWKEIELLLDHQYLNDTIPAAYQPTTAENIARFILDRLADKLSNLSRVALYETPTSKVEVRREDV